MLSSRNNRFSWSKQDRSPDLPFFRALSRNWRPAVRKKEPEPDAADAAAKNDAKPVDGKTARPVWTPWLWVDN